MSSRPSLLARLWRKLTSAERPANAASVKPRKLGAKPPKSKRPVSSALEPLEGRIAPATLLNPTTLIYTDVDGDNVTVKFSKPLLTDALVSSVFKFTNGTAGQQLQTINLAAFTPSSGPNPAAGLSITITAEHGLTPTSDGFFSQDGYANVGAISASGIPLGSITIDGDLGQIDCGSNSAATGLASLTVHSLGAKTTTQSGSPTFESSIIGALGSLKADFIEGAYVHVVNGTSSVFFSSPAVGKIGTVSIGLYMSARTGSTTGFSGAIQADSTIGSLSIGTAAAPAPVDYGPLEGSSGSTPPAPIVKGLIGGGGVKSGAVLAGESIGKIFIDGDIRGGLGDSSGLISSGRDIGSVTISGKIQGGGTEASAAGARSGGVFANGNLGAVDLKGSLTGGNGLFSGFIEGAGDVKSVTIGGDVLGFKGQSSGVITSGGSLASVAIHGNLSGGEGLKSGSVFAGYSGTGDLKSIKVDGALIGGAGNYSGFIHSAGRLDSLTIGNIKAAPTLPLLRGGAGVFSAGVYAEAGIGSAAIYGNAQGGLGNDSGSVEAGGVIGSIVAGNFTGGNGARSGAIYAHDFYDDGDQVAGAILKARIGRMTGGEGEYSGGIFADAGMADVQVALLMTSTTPAPIGSGSLITGLGFVGTGDSGKIAVSAVSGSSILINGSLGSLSSLSPTVGNFFSAVVRIDGDAGAVTLGTVSNTSIETNGSLGVLAANALQNSTSVLVHGSLGALKLGASGRSVLDHATIRVQDSIGSVTVTSLKDTVISARGQAVPSATSDVAIGSVKVTGKGGALAPSVDHSLILAGYDLTGAGVNADAQIGAVSVAGDWRASSIAAGVDPVSGTSFGDADDREIAVQNSDKIVSQIASIVIKGSVWGTADDTGDHFGFVAQRIGSFKAGAGPAVKLTAAAGEVFELAKSSSSQTGSDDVTVREVPILEHVVVT